jgi:hypothetical protein
MKEIFIRQELGNINGKTLTLTASLYKPGGILKRKTFTPTTTMRTVILFENWAPLNCKPFRHNKLGMMKRHRNHHE